MYVLTGVGNNRIASCVSKPLDFRREIELHNCSSSASAADLDVHGEKSL